MRDFTIIIVTTVLTTIFTTLMIWAIECDKRKECVELNNNFIEYYEAVEKVLDTIAVDNDAYFYDVLIEGDLYQNYESAKAKVENKVK